MSAPVRIQRKRERGWRMPEGAVYVGRLSLFGNPWTPGEAWGFTDAPTPRQRAEWAVQQYREELTHFGLMSDWGAHTTHDRWEEMDALITENGWRDMADVARHLLWGATALACWCPLVDADGQPVPCHADVLIELLS